MRFFRHDNAFCVRAEMSADAVTLKLTLEAERVPDPYVRQVPNWPGSKPTPPERVREAVLAGAEAANRSFGTSFWPLAIEFQVEREYTATQTLERFTREIIERLARHGTSGFEDAAGGKAR